MENVDNLINKSCDAVLHDIYNAQQLTPINKTKHLNLVRVDYYKNLIEISTSIVSLASQNNHVDIDTNQQIKILEQNKKELDTQYINIVKLMQQQFEKWEKYQTDIKNELTSQIKNLHNELNQICIDDINNFKQKQQLQQIENNQNVDESNDIQIKSEPVPYLEDIEDDDAKIDNNNNNNNNNNAMETDKFECTKCEFATFIVSEFTHHLMQQHSQQITASTASLVPGLEPLENTTATISNTFVTNNTNNYIDCKICCKTFLTESIAMLHFDIHGRENCAVCNIAYGTEIIDVQKDDRCYDKHKFILNKFSKISKLKCRYCPYMTVIKNNFNHHQLSHKELNSTPRSFFHTKKRKQGKKNNNTSSTSTNSVSDRHKCIQKNKKNKSKKEYYYPTSYPCQHCKYVGRCKTALDNHIRTHTNEKPFECKKCGVRFTVKCNLRNHITNIHENKRQHKCLYPNCYKAFNSSYKLKQHNYKHTGEKPYKCKHCEDMFASSVHRKKHEKNLHIGWECSFCGDKFEKEYQLKRHGKEMHSTTNFSKANWFAYGCERCGQRFKTMEEAELHGRECDEDMDGVNELDKILNRERNNYNKSWKAKRSNWKKSKNKMNKKRRRDSFNNESKEIRKETSKEPSRKKRKLMIKIKRSKFKNIVAAS